MHSSSMLRMKWFLENYKEYFPHSGKKIKVLDLGSYNVNGCYRELMSDEFEYCGIDIEEGPNVDIVLEDAYHWKQLESDSYDVVLSGQAFEHIEYPWISMKELCRVLKPDGILCIIAPHTAREHKYPFDCWRFYSDGLPALSKWCDLELLHSSIAGVPDYFVSEEWDDTSNDAMMIAKKKGKYRIYDAPQFPYERRVYGFEYKYRYRFMFKWFEYLNTNKQISEYLIKSGYKNIVVLAVDEIANLLIEDISNNSGDKVEIKGILTYKKKFTFVDKRICDINNLGNVDAIVIADPDYQKRIETYLREKVSERVQLINLEFIIDTLLRDYCVCVGGGAD